MVRVTERIEGTLDSESTESSIHVVAPTENQEVAPKKPKIQSKQPIEQSYPKAFVDVQIFNSNMDRIEASHLNSIRCLESLYKMEKNSLVDDAISNHEKNISMTSKILFCQVASSEKANEEVYNEIL